MWLSVAESLLSDTAEAVQKSSSEGSGSWMHAFPSVNLGLLLNDREVRVSVGLRLGAKIVSQHTCVCGSLVQSVGHQGLSCRRSAGCHSRHHAVNDILARTLRNVPAMLEPPGLIRGDSMEIKMA